MRKRCSAPLAADSLSCFRYALPFVCLVFAVSSIGVAFGEGWRAERLVYKQCQSKRLPRGSCG